MNSPEKNLKPSGERPSGNPGSSGGHKFPLWGGIVLALLVVAALVLLFRLEHQLTHLTSQTEEANRRLAQVEASSKSALTRASQAEQSAQQAAQERDQAKRAQAQSEQVAQNAKQQAATAQEEAATAQQAATKARQKAQEYRRQREAELSRLQKVLGQIAETRRTAMGLIMTLGSESVRFDFDKSYIKPQYRETLSRIAGVLSTLKGYQIYVYGYTDDIGTKEYNQKLSERRANAVRDFLVKSGINPNIIVAKGYGESDPRVHGDSPKARAMNRRVEIGIVDSSLQVQGPAPPQKNK